MRERPIEELLRPALDEAAVARLHRRLRAARERRPARKLVTGSLVLATMIAAAITVALWDGEPPRENAPGALASRATTLEAGTSLRVRALALDDGSRIELGQSARMEVLANDGERFVTALRAGRGRFDVRPGGPRRWSIETDLASVEVVGTAFTVDRTPSGLRVEVERGVVLVRGERVPGRVQRLTAGGRLEIAEPVATRPAPAPIEAAPAPMPEPPRTQARPAPPSLAETLARADGERSAGRPEVAARILADALARRPSDPSASLVAFSLGRLELELGQPDNAAAHFGAMITRRSPR
ncbi:MAG: FecR domain-containing protein, partial [Sandaracinaceae bacterium]|nr:FecR domain-containing protein [Sandaracinaceae bacterium]